MLWLLNTPSSSCLSDVYDSRYEQLWLRKKHVLKWLDRHCPNIPILITPHVEKPDVNLATLHPIQNQLLILFKCRIIPRTDKTPHYLFLSKTPYNTLFTHQIRIFFPLSTTSIYSITSRSLVSLNQALL